MQVTTSLCLMAALSGYLCGSLPSGPFVDEEYTCTQGCVASTEVVVYTRNTQNHTWVEAGTPGDYIEYQEGPFMKDGTCHCDPQCEADTSTDEKKCRVGAKFKFKASAGIQRMQEQTGGSQPGITIPGAYCETVTSESVQGVDIRVCGTDTTSWYLGFTTTNCNAGTLLVKIKYRCTPCNGTCPSEPV